MPQFTCPACKMVHSHDDRKHTLKIVKSIPDWVVPVLEYDERCHCGWHEAMAMYMNDEFALEGDDVEGFIRTVRRMAIPNTAEADIWGEDGPQFPDHELAESMVNVTVQVPVTHDADAGPYEIEDMAVDEIVPDGYSHSDVEVFSTEPVYDPESR